MAKLSNVFSNKRKKADSHDKSSFVGRMSSRKLIRKSNENALTGNLFIKCVEDTIVDVNNNHEIIVSRATTSDAIKNLNKDKSIYFNGIDNNINVVDSNYLNLGMDDFTIDWWEYKLSIPKPNPDEINSTQFSFYKNSTDRKQPISIKNTDHKSIYLSSDGDHWDIADDKYMGTIVENKWTHWVIARSNNNFYTFKNGGLKNIWISDKPINGSDGFLTLGSGPTGNNFYGYIVNFRLVKSQTLWVEEFDLKKDLYY